MFDFLARVFVVVCIGIFMVGAVWVITKVITAGIIETIYYYKEKYKKGGKNDG